MADRLPTVAIAGATGHLGQYIARACLEPDAKSKFSKVILLSRNPDHVSPQVLEWRDQGGAVIRGYDEDDLSAALADVDVVINAIGPSGHHFRDKLVRALSKTPVKLYFPSEFGCDHTVHDFSHEEWDHKKEHYQLALQVAPDIKICRVFIGLFIEDSIGPWFGFHTSADRYECVGSADTATTYTGLLDAGRAVASLASMKPDQVPVKVHVASDTVTVRDMAALMHRAGAGDISVEEVDLDSFKKQALAHPERDPSKYLRFAMGENKINHTAGALGNDNSLVNLGEGLWTWQKMSDYADATKGRPWADFAWK